MVYFFYSSSELAEAGGPQWTEWLVFSSSCFHFHPQVSCWSWSMLNATSNSCAGLISGYIANVESFLRVSGAILISEIQITNHCTAPGLQAWLCVSPEAVLKPLQLSWGIFLKAILDLSYFSSFSGWLVYTWLGFPNQAMEISSLSSFLRIIEISAWISLWQSVRQACRGLVLAHLPYLLSLWLLTEQITFPQAWGVYTTDLEYLLFCNRWDYECRRFSSWCSWTPLDQCSVLFLCLLSFCIFFTFVWWI